MFFPKFFDAAPGITVRDRPTIRTSSSSMQMWILEATPQTAPHMRIPIEESNMKLTIPAPFQPAPCALEAFHAAPTADAAAGFQSRRQTWGVMIRNWLSSRQVQILLAITLFGVERIAAQVFGVNLFPGLGAETGLLLFWGIGHCDTLDGPLVTLAKKALEVNNVNLVLPWVRPEDEPEIQHAFDHAQVVRELGPEARSLADRHFLETLVRIHRAGEGAPFTGLKPAGLDLGPAVPAADHALNAGSVDAVVKLLVDAVSAGVRARFHAATERQPFDPNDVAAGRRYVQAYVPYVHYVEQLWKVATGPLHGHSAGHEAQDHQGEHAVHHH